MPHISRHSFSEHLVSEPSTHSFRWRVLDWGVNLELAGSSPPRRQVREMQRREPGSRVPPPSRVLPTGPVTVQAAPEARREPEAPAPVPGPSYVTRGSLYFGFPGSTSSNEPASSTGDPRDVGSVTREDPRDAGSVTRGDPRDVGSVTRGDPRDVGSVTREDPPEEVTATPSSALAWRTPRTEEPGGLQSMGSQRVRHDGRDLAHTLLCFTLDHFAVFRAFFLFAFCFSACPKTAS